MDDAGGIIIIAATAPDETELLMIGTDSVFTIVGLPSTVGFEVGELLTLNNEDEFTPSMTDNWS